ncbi:MAG: ABC transporter permease [Propionibacteriaceae bacterium]|jgi:peptide/nickel transport system permease protein|nr:ABC transporter permease [Propionibacteriaceae bacterium]
MNPSNRPDQAPAASTAPAASPPKLTRERKPASRRSALARYLAVRLVLIIPTVWILVTVVFFLMRLTGDPITAMLGGKASPEEIARRRHEAGYDRPLLVQYGDYLLGILRGDFGRSMTNGNYTIGHILATYGPATVELVFWALIVAFAVGIPLGRLAARHYNRLADVSIRTFAILFYAAPVFFVALVLKLIFSQWLGWLPISGRASTRVAVVLDSKVDPDTGVYILNAILYGDFSYILDVLQHAVLPGLTLGLLTAGVFIRLVRINLLQTLRADYVMAARARGVPEGAVVRKHAFRNALIPVVTVMGMQIALMLAGAILTETSFEWQGLGFWLAKYLTARDFVAVQGIVAAIAVIVAAASFVIDAVNAFIDPRVRY